MSTDREPGAGCVPFPSFGLYGSRPETTTVGRRAAGRRNGSVE